MDSNRTLAPTVAVLGGDRIVGQTLELLLQSTGNTVIFLAEPSSNDLELLDGAQLLVLAPGIGAECREALLALIGITPTTAETPILELVATTTENQIGRMEPGLLVHWPCRAEDLKRRIDDILLAGAEARQATAEIRAPGEKQWR